MKNKFEKGIESIKKLSLSKSEKQFVLQNILLKTGMQTNARPAFWNFTNFNMNYSYMAFAVFILVFISGSAYVMAENALPGDRLYMLKVNVNEPLRGAVLIDSEARVDWQAEKVSRRLEEVEALAREGRLDEEKTESIKKKIESNIDTFSKVMIKVEKKNSKKAAEVQHKLQIKTEDNQKNLEEIEKETNEPQKSQVESIKDSIKKKMEKQKKDYENRESKQNSKGENDDELEEDF